MGSACADGLKTPFQNIYSALGKTNSALGNTNKALTALTERMDKLATAEQVKPLSGKTDKLAPAEQVSDIQAAVNELKEGQGRLEQFASAMSTHAGIENKGDKDKDKGDKDNDGAVAATKMNKTHVSLAFGLGALAGGLFVQYGLPALTGNGQVTETPTLGVVNG